MNSLMSEMPGPLVAVNARAPIQPAPMTMPAAASSSSAWTMATRRRPVSGSFRNRRLKAVKASTREVLGVMGYQPTTVAPA